MVGDRPAGTRVGQDIANCLQEIVRDYWDGSHNQLMSAGPPYGDGYDILVMEFVPSTLAPRPQLQQLVLGILPGGTFFGLSYTVRLTS